MNTELKASAQKHNTYNGSLYVFPFEFYIMCFWDCDFPFRTLDKKIYSEFADSRKEKKRMQRDKNGNANNVVFYAILAHPSFMQFLVKIQKSQTHNSKYLIQNTMSHIGFRIYVTLCSVLGPLYGSPGSSFNFYFHDFLLLTS